MHRLRGLRFERQTGDHAQRMPLGCHSTGKSTGERIMISMMNGSAQIDKQIFSGVILSGGKNTRHRGRNKALLSVGGLRIIDRIIEVMQPVFDQLIIVTNDLTAYRGLNVAFTNDSFKTRCSLTGLHAGLQAVKTRKAFVVGCDAPFIKKEMIDALLHFDRPDVDVTVPSTQAGLEPLFAIYSKSCLDVITQHLLQKRYKVSDIYSRLRVQTVDEGYLRKADPELISFFNVNTPDLISKAEAISLRLLQC